MHCLTMTAKFCSRCSPYLILHTNRRPGERRKRRLLLSPALPLPNIAPRKASKIPSQSQNIFLLGSRPKGSERPQQRRQLNYEIELQKRKKVFCYLVQAVHVKHSKNSGLSLQLAPKMVTISGITDRTNMLFM